MQFRVNSKAEPSQEGFLLITIAAIGAYIGISAIINRIKNIKEQKNPTLIIDRYFGKSDFQNVINEYPLNTKDSPIELDQAKIDDYIDILRDSDGWYHPSKSKWIPCQTLTYWIKHYSVLATFVSGFSRLISSKQVDKDTQALSDSLFGPNAFVGNKTRFATSTSRFRWHSPIEDKKNGYNPSSLLGFPNEWSSDIGYKKGNSVNAERQKVVEACLSLRKPIEEAMKTEGKSEEQLKQHLGYLQLAIFILDSVKMSLNCFDYDSNEYTETIDMTRK